jgi:hypothetical protein
MFDINQIYFESLFNKFKQKTQKSLILRQPELDIESSVIPLAIANEEERESLYVKQYGELKDGDLSHLKNFTYTLIKMQAGLGTSVERADLIERVEGRKELGAKGTDLYFEVNGKLTSIAEIQLLQAYSLSRLSPYKKIKYVNLVNDETKLAVEKIWRNSFLNADFASVFDKDERLERGEYFQNKMPTVDKETGLLTTDRLAPAGHGLIGHMEIINTYLNPESDEIVAIGNGEDLCSTPDDKIINWIVNENLPIVMITTTKTHADKKGGQISLVKGNPDYVTIVEKAQAEASHQLAYFEELGLRPNDKESLFNTNIVVINKKALKEKFDLYLKDVPFESFIQAFAPDVICNEKVQDGRSFIQLESALGSVMLNLDQYFRRDFHSSLVSFLNLNPKERELFFMPIKKREDYDYLVSQFKVDGESFRLVRGDYNP